MLHQLQRQGPALSWKTGNDTMEGNGGDPHQDKARRFRDAALPYLDDVYTLARYLLRNTGDAEDAVQECYLRALRHFDTSRPGDQALAVRHPAQRVSWRIRAPIQRPTLH